jgi:hypothetical protein
MKRWSGVSLKTSPTSKYEIEGRPTIASNHPKK